MVWDLGVDKVIWLGPIRMCDFDTTHTSSSAFSHYFCIFVFWSHVIFYVINLRKTKNTLYLQFILLFCPEKIALTKHNKFIFIICDQKSLFYYE